MRYDINKDALNQYLNIKSECLRNKTLNSYTKNLFSALAAGSFGGIVGNMLNLSIPTAPAELDEDIFIGRVFTKIPTMQKYNGELVLSVQSGNDGSNNYRIDTMVLSTGKYVNFSINELTREDFELKTMDEEGVIH